MEKRGWLMKVIPWVLIVLGIFTLDMLYGLIAITCMVIGIMMLIERRWPEHWGVDLEKQ